MKLNKLKTFNIAELSKEYKEKALKLKQYELDLKSGKEKDSAKVKFLRRDVSRILTLINQKIQLELVESVIEDIKKLDKMTEKEPKEEVKKVEEKKEEIKTKKETTKKETIKK